MKILLAVSGSIACYKAYDLLRSLIKAEHEVKVVLSSGAKQFIKAETFKYLGALEVFEHTDDFNPKLLGPSQTVLHIELARWCDTFVLYPASANMISNLSFGKADDLTSAIYLSLEKQVKKIIFPAMNKEMYSNEITQRNLEVLEPYIITPNQGHLACGETGVGKLPLPDEAKDLIETLAKDQKSKRVLISTGATKSPLDSVRYLTNPSSGKTGYYLAKTFLSQGYQVDLIYTESSISLISNLEKNKNLSLYKVKTTPQLESKTLELFPHSDLFISAAAPCDIAFEYNSQKMKKSHFQKSLPITKTSDILSKCIEKKSNQLIVGFAAETQSSEQVILEKMKRKPVDLLVFNNVNNALNNEKLKGFGVEENTYRLISKKSDSLITISKKVLGDHILNTIREIDPLWI